MQKTSQSALALRRVALGQAALFYLSCFWLEHSVAWVVIQVEVCGLHAHAFVVSFTNFDD